MGSWFSGILGCRHLASTAVTGPKVLGRTTKRVLNNHLSLCVLNELVKEWLELHTPCMYLDPSDVV